MYCQHCGNRQHSGPCTRKKIRCYKCKGSGEVREFDWLVGAFTLGLTLLMDASDPNTCDACDGKGWIYE